MSRHLLPSFPASDVPPLPVLRGRAGVRVWSPLPLRERVRVRGECEESIGVTAHLGSDIYPSPPPSPERGEGGCRAAVRHTRSFVGDPNPPHRANPRRVP